MKFVLLTVPSAKEDWSDLSMDLYRTKIGHYVKMEVQEVKPSKVSRVQAEQKVDLESKKILETLSPDDYVVLFDERGLALDSPQFAKKIEQIMNSGKKRAVFVLGGAFGVSDEVRKRANLQVSFSKMVFNHLVAQVVALEQIYRGFTILKNIPYHNP